MNPHQRALRNVTLAAAVALVALTFGALMEPDRRHRRADHLRRQLHMRDHDDDYHDALPDELDEHLRAIVGDDHEVDDDDIGPTATACILEYVLDHADVLDDDLVDLAAHGILVIDDRLADHFRAVATGGGAAGDALT